MTTRIDWNDRFSKEARGKPLPSLQSHTSKHTGLSGMIGMHGGLPPSDAFPFQGFDCLLSNANSGSSNSSTQQAAAAVQPDLAASSAAEAVLHITDPVMIAAAQQYCFYVKGYPPLQAWAQDFVYQQQQPATLRTTTTTTTSSSSSSSSGGSSQEPIGCDVIITAGNSSALDALTRVLLNPGDPLLLEEFTYSHFPETQVLPMGCELVPVQLDHEGLSPSHLDSLMTSRQSSGLTLPRVLYTIPTGQNPTGSVMSQQRMAEVYQLAQKWDLVIIEDDAYYWLQYPDGPDKVPGLNLRPGFLSLDTDGRVIRIDTLAKLLGPGFRLGWLAAPPAVALKVGLYLASSTIGASSLSQVMIHQLLDKWGREGLEKFVRDLQQRYARNAAVAAEAAEEHLAGLAEWRPAKAGMFMWMKMIGDSADSSKLVEYAAAEKVMIVPGRYMSVSHLQAAAADLRRQQQEDQQLKQQRDHPQGSTQHQEQRAAGVESSADPCPYFRLSFASVQSDDAIKEGCARLGQALRKCRAGS